MCAYVRENTSHKRQTSSLRHTRVHKRQSTTPDRQRY
nr:MAG TPA: hypothetical protein [Caudoviricetes sp.]